VWRKPLKAGEAVLVINLCGEAQRVRASWQELGLHVVRRPLRPFWRPF
jgi:hypothetical protein